MMNKRIEAAENMQDVLYIADAFLWYAKSEGKQLTPQQLVKLCCLAQFMNQSITGQPLFSEKMEEWTYGLMIPVLYRALKPYGREVIPLDKIDGKCALLLPEQAMKVVNDVWRMYGHLSGPYLANIVSQHLRGMKNGSLCR